MPNLGRPIVRAGTDELGDAVRQTIRAYHGSPYDFDRFDASKIGAGAGRQAYGHGFYFSDSEPLADTYRSSTSALRRTPEEDALELWRRQAELHGDPKRGVLSAIDTAEERLEEAAGMPMAQQRWDDILQHLYGIDYRQPLPKKAGAMLEVEIGVPRESLLDYEQPFRSPAGAKAANVLARVAPGAIDPSTLRRIQDGPDRMTIYPDQAERSLAARRIRKLAENPNGAAELFKAGIPGVQYVDDSMVSSKGIGPARNYVMFPGTEDSIRILRKYGLLAPIAGATMSPDETLDSR
jgi:hypothetical protein